MSPDFFVFSSMALTHGAAIGFAIRELILLRRYRDPGNGRDRPPPIKPRRPKGGEPTRKPLPACLIPPPITARTPAKVLEDA